MRVEPPPPESDDPDEWRRWLDRTWDNDESWWRGHEPLSLWDDRGSDHPSTVDVHRGAHLVPRRRPTSELQALMESAPHQEAESHQDERETLQQAVRAAIDALPSELVATYEAIYVDGMTLQPFGEAMGWGVGARAKSKAYRRRERMQELVRAALHGAPELRALTPAHAGAGQPPPVPTSTPMT